MKILYYCIFLVVQMLPTKAISNAVWITIVLKNVCWMHHTLTLLSFFESLLLIREKILEWREDSVAGFTFLVPLCQWVPLRSFRDTKAVQHRKHSRMALKIHIPFLIWAFIMFEMKFFLKERLFSFKPLSQVQIKKTIND